MLSLHKKKRTILSALVAVAVLVPMVLAVITNQLSNVQAATVYVYTIGSSTGITVTDVYDESSETAGGVAITGSAYISLDEDCYEASDGDVTIAASCLDEIGLGDYDLIIGYSGDNYSGDTWYTLDIIDGETFTGAYYTYTLEFYANAGEDTVTNMPEDLYLTSTEDYDTFSFILPSEVPEREGYTFVGWGHKPYSSGTGSEWGWVNQPGATVHFALDTQYLMNLYAVWEEDTTEITSWTFYLNFDDGVTDSSVTNMPESLSYGPTSSDEHNFRLPGEIPVRAGYTFAGWDITNSSTANLIYDDETIYARRYQAGQLVKIGRRSESTDSPAVTAVAAWNEESSGGDDDTPSTQIVTFSDVTGGAVSKTYGDSDFTYTATTMGDGAITYSSSDTAVATVGSTGKVSIVGAGSTVITATAAATDNYYAGSASYTLTVEKKSSSSVTIPDEVGEVKTGYVNDTLSTLEFNTVGLEWADENETIALGENSYSVNYTVNGDADNYTTVTYEITVDGIRKEYDMLSGDEQEYVSGSDEYLVFEFDVDYDLFKEDGVVYVDGVLLDPEYYESNGDSESTAIKISGSYLDMLGEGEHEVTIYFDDNGGMATARFSVVDDGDTDADSDSDSGTDTGDGEEEGVVVPDTGENTNGENGNLMIVLWMPLLITTVAGAMVFSRRRMAHRKFEW